MYQDEIIAEVWRNRDAYVEEHHHSLVEIVADLKRRQELHRDRMIDRRSDGRSPDQAATTARSRTAASS